ncbi:MAG TPA: helix-turn-helix domain-containing protein [Treponemataceae bacterium]|jgi:AcrR family transcriptional regulator|nr:MAG: Fatty acid metabolism regulator protein [Spirochaetes bacterium ADurb.Bin215]HPA11476.1 helix-turn-helix domain-containing protein [Treponemataceae bacterium]
MGIAERKKRERKNRRQVILDSARDIILERGVEAVSMSDIARECELSKATLYLYYSNKESLLEALFTEAVTSFVEYAESRISDSDSGIEAISTLWRCYLDRFRNSNDIFVLVGVKNFIAPSFPLLYEPADKTSRRAGSRMLSLVQEVIERGLHDGTLETSLDAKTLSRTVFIIASGIVDSVARLPRDLRDMSIVLAEMQRVFELLLRGMAAPGVDRSQLSLSEN